MIELIPPKIEYLNQYLEGYKEYKKFNLKFEDIENFNEPFNWSKYIKKVNNLQYNYEIPKSIFWLVDKTKYIGTGILRHNLTRKTEEYEGHINYTIRPSLKYCNYDSNFIKLLLEQAKKQKINSALMVLCDENIDHTSIFKDIKVFILDKKEHTINKKNIKLTRYIINTGLGINKYINKNFNPVLKDFEIIKNNEIFLKINNIYKDPTDEINLKLYEFFIYETLKSSKVGRITLRIGCNDGIYYSGNIGYSIIKNFRGKYYSGKSCILIKELLKNFKIYDKLSITVNPNNLPSRKNCEYINAKLLEIVNIPKNNEMYIKGERQKCRYIF